MYCGDFKDHLFFAGNIAKPAKNHPKKKVFVFSLNTKREIHSPIRECECFEGSTGWDPSTFREKLEAFPVSPPDLNLNSQDIIKKNGSFKDDTSWLEMWLFEGNCL